MKNFAAVSLLLVGILFAVPVFPIVSPVFSIETAEAAVRVNGYYRKNGTYVAPHYRSNPDGNPYNNWSYPGNTNPYTGKTATGNPSTYLNNYNNGGSSYTPSFSIPSYSPSYSIPSITTPTWHSCIEFGLGASYSYLTEQCECGYGYTARNNRCVSADDACQEDYGNNSRSTLGGKCECRYGYRWNASGNKCISNEDYCQELDWNAEYDILKDSCVCKDGYKAGITGSSCVIEESGYRYDTPTYPQTPTCPANSYENPSNPSKCLCNAGYVISSSKDSCVPLIRESYPSSGIDTHSHSTNKGVICNAGYKKTAGVCKFNKCPIATIFNAATKECDADYSKIGKSVACISRNPCVCTAGYEPLSNKKCIPTSTGSSYLPTGTNPCSEGFLFRSGGKPSAQYGEYWVETPSGACKSAIGLCGANPKYSQTSGQCTKCQEGSFLVNGDCLLYAP